MTYTNPIIMFLFLSLSLLPLIQTQLTTNYYQKSCPKFSDIVRKTVIDKQISVLTTAPTIFSTTTAWWAAATPPS